MARGVCWYLVGSFVLVSLAGCGRGLFQTAEREPWRAEAEAACLKSGAVKENPDLVRIDPIAGPGVCGAEFPLKVAALGEGDSVAGFADEVRPPGSVGNQPRWPVAPNASYPEAAVRQPGYGSNTGAGPISLNAPGVLSDDGEINLPPEGQPGYYGRRRAANGAPESYPPADRGYPPMYQSRQDFAPGSPQQNPLPKLGPSTGNVGAVGAVAVKPAATLACPIVSALDHWLADSVQPAALRWFGARVVEIKQISAYSCRGMNGNPHAHISEHAFGNALDVAAFTLADGRRVVVKDGWHGMAEEQGFLRDVQGGACQTFNTVLAPGSNVYHYDHIHVDLMRRSSRRIICQPAAVSGEEVASRVTRRNPYAMRETPVTGSLGGRHALSKRAKVNEEDEFEDE